MKQVMKQNFGRDILVLPRSQGAAIYRYFLVYDYPNLLVDVIFSPSQYSCQGRNRSHNIDREARCEFWYGLPKIMALPSFFIFPCTYIQDDYAVEIISLS